MSRLLIIGCGGVAGMHKTGQRQIIIEAKEPIDIISICLKTRKKNVYLSIVFNI